MKTTNHNLIYISIIAIFFAAGSIYLSGCKKEDQLAAINDSIPSPSANTSTVTVAGRVLNEWNSPIQYAEVTLGSTTVITDESGLYALNQVSFSGERGVIKIGKPGFVTNFLGVTKENAVQYLNVILPTISTASFTNTAGGTITTTHFGAKLVFPPNAVVNVDGSPYTGQVYVYYNISDNEDSTYRIKFPGNDRAATNLQNEQKQFRTFSCMYVGLFTATSAKLKMAPGKTVSIQLPIPASQQGTAPATAVFCSFNEQTALWNEEVTATRNGNFYEASVSHFTFWSCGSFYAAAYLTGRVTDCNNNPLPNIVVYFDYDNYEFTDNNGYFIKMVPGNITFPVQVPPANGIGVFSPQFSVGPITPGQSYDMGNIVLQCPAYLTGNMRDCNNNGVPAWVQVNYGSQYGFTGIYSTTGAFTLPVKSNMTVGMRYASLNKIVSSSATTPAPGLTTNVGNIAMCYTPDTANVITLNGAGFVNETLLLDVTSSSAQYRQAGQTYLSLTGTTLQGKTVTIYGYFNGNTNGNYTCDAGLVNYTDVFIVNGLNTQDNIKLSSDVAGASSNIQVLSYGTEIGRIKAYLTGTLVSSASTGSQPATISGKIDLPRMPDMRSVSPSMLTANGDGFTNQTIQFDWCSSTSYYAGYVAGNYHSATNETVLKFYGCISSANGGFGGTLKFKGNGPGTYTAPADFYTSGFSIRPVFNGITTKQYTELVSGSLTISSYQPVGGYISGTFSGVFKRTDPFTGQAVTVNVTNASISNWHFTDQ